MRVSVVIPCHNSLRYLPETVDSVLAQDFVDLELVLVDDGGDDDLASWAATVGDDRVRVERQPNAGVASARNLGIDVARGELIALLDSDDLWEPTALSALVSAYDTKLADGRPGRRPVGLAYGWHDVVDADGSPNGRVVSARLEGDVWDDFVCGSVVAIGSAVVPAAVFAEVGGFVVNRDRFAVDVEDWELWIRIAASYEVAVAPELVLHVRRHEANSTGAGATASLDAAYRSLFDRVFDEANVPTRDPARLRRLKSQAASRAELILAWHSLNLDDDPAAAERYLRAARRHRPGVWRDPDHLRAATAVSARRVLGPRGLRVVRAASHVARRGINRLRFAAGRAGGGRGPVDG